MRAWSDGRHEVTPTWRFEAKQVLAYERVDEFLALSLALGNKGHHCVIENLTTEKKKAVRLSWVESGKGLQIKSGRGDLRSPTTPTQFSGHPVRWVAQILYMLPSRNAFVGCLICSWGRSMVPGRHPGTGFSRALGGPAPGALVGVIFLKPEFPACSAPAFRLGKGSRTCFCPGDPTTETPGGSALTWARRAGLGPPQTLRHGGFVGQSSSPTVVLPHRRGRHRVDWRASATGHARRGAPLTLLWRPLMAGKCSDPEESTHLISAADDCWRDFGCTSALQTSPGDLRRELPDAGEAIKGEGYGRRERFEDSSGALGSCSTPFPGTSGTTAVGPGLSRQRPHLSSKEDVVLSFGPGVYEDALREDSCGSLEDGRFTALNLFGWRRCASGSKRQKELENDRVAVVVRHGSIVCIALLYSIPAGWRRQGGFYAIIPPEFDPGLKNKGEYEAMKRTRRTGLSAVFLFFLVLNVLLGGTAAEAARPPRPRKNPFHGWNMWFAPGRMRRAFATRHHLKSQYLLWANDLAPQASSGSVLLIPVLPQVARHPHGSAGPQSEGSTEPGDQSGGKPSEKPTEKPSGKPSGVAKGTPGHSRPSRLPDAAQTKGTMKSSELDSLLAAMTPEQRKLFGPKVPSKSTEDENAVVVDGGRRAPGWVHLACGGASLQRIRHARWGQDQERPGSPGPVP